MISNRIIPVLLVKHGRLVKTVGFTKEVYVGDPVNAVRIFNEKAADELIVFDIGCSRFGCGPDEPLIRRLASECFMPLGYGGGVTTIGQAKRLFELGVEKVSVNTGLRSNCLRPMADSFGSQSVVYCLDARRRADGGLRAFGKHGSEDLGPAVECAQEAVSQGAGEIIFHMIDREGTFCGYDIDAIRLVSGSVPVPVVACGGARHLDDFRGAMKAGASAVAAGSLFVFIGRLRGVLISYPSEAERESIS